jgi:hypothetical protein
MDALKKLKLEYNGIKDTIKKYTSRGNVINHLNQLEIALNENDILAIRYCLKELTEWYFNNISAIYANNYVHDETDHDRNKNLIEKLEIDMRTYELKAITLNKNDRYSEEPFIFLSHKSDDKRYGDALEKLIVGLGVKNKQLIYTSHPLHKIPLDEDIYDYLRKHFKTKVFMIILWSDKYLESPACLNEMGAAWVTQSDYTNMFVPSFSFGNPKFHECAVDARKMGALLNGDEHCRASMIEFKNKIQELFDLDNDEANTSFLLDSFNKQILEATTNGQA